MIHILNIFLMGFPDKPILLYLELYEAFTLNLFRKVLHKYFPNQHIIKAETINSWLFKQIQIAVNLPIKLIPVLSVADNNQAIIIEV